MRRSDKQITDESIITEILVQSEICRIGMVDMGEAYIVPVNYAYEDGCIYIHSAPGGRKIDLLKQNNQVSFEIELSNEIIKNEMPCGWSAKYRSVMGRGTVSIENDIQIKKRYLDLIMRKYGADMELNYDGSIIAGMIILKLKIGYITGKQSGIW